MRKVHSGIGFNEDYLDFYSDINRMGRVLALGASMDQFAIDRTVSVRPPGSVWQYNSIDTHVIGMALRAATRQSVKQYLTQKPSLHCGRSSIRNPDHSSL